MPSSAATAQRLKDELGDLLFQVVFHAQMAEETGAFRFRGGGGSHLRQADAPPSARVRQPRRSLDAPRSKARLGGHQGAGARATARRRAAAPRRATGRRAARRCRR